MFALRNVTVSFAGRRVLDNVSWSLAPGDRVGVVGANGSGKSTLLKTLAGLIKPDAGCVQRPKRCSVAYLPQEVYQALTLSVWDEAASVFADVLELGRQIASLEAAIASASTDDQALQPLLQKYGWCRERFEQLEGFSVEAKIGSVLLGLGFSKSDWQRPSSQFSGGWQMRIALAKVLLRRPDLLLLDEPTNYLDIDALQWLEEYLLNYKGTLIIVSHDRYFLDRAVNRITEIQLGKLRHFHGNFSFYESQRQKNHQLLLQQYKRQQEQIAQIQAFINRFRANASKARLVQSRIKRLEKLRRISPPKAQESLNFQLPAGPRGAREVIRLEGVTKAYAKNTVLCSVNLAIYRKERIAVVGKNGAGKSTLLRVVAGMEPIDSGERKVGQDIRIAYFSQDQQAGLLAENTVLEEVMRSAPVDMVPRLRSILGAFLFSGDEVNKKVKVLSGGEKSRLVLAKLMLQGANLLVLDEPTNHLDIPAKQAFEAALRSFDGTILIVSHDRRLMNRLATKVVEVADGRLTVFLGNFDDYVSKKAQLARPRAVASARARPGVPPASGLPHPKSRAGKQLRRQLNQEKKAVSDEISNLQSQLARLEEQIGQKERRLALLREAMAKTKSSQTEAQIDELLAESKRIRKRLPSLYRKWDALLARQEELQARLLKLQRNLGSEST